MSPEEVEVLKALRSKGYAVVVFSPDELRDADKDDVEQDLVLAGWDIIDAHAKYPDPAYE